jgi:hypothetical protein
MICLALALGALSLALAACGGGSDEGPSQLDTVTEEGLPPDAPQKKVIATQFPKPKPIAGAPKGAMKAIHAGEKACAGKTPQEVRDEFLAAAQEGGRLNEGQEKMLAQLPRYEKQSRTSPDFAAGQLAAGVYEATLPEKLARSGYQGCVYALAVQLRHELSGQGKKGKAKSG